MLALKPHLFTPIGSPHCGHLPLNWPPLNAPRLYVAGAFFVSVRPDH